MIRKRNLDPSLVNWIMNETGLGPGIGEIHYVAAATSAYHDRLHNEMNVPAENIHTTIAAGTAAHNNRNTIRFLRAHVQAHY